MRKIRGSTFVSLDGVMQAPGGPTEDPTGGFAHGGWLPQFFDEDVGEAIGAFFGDNYDLLLGRRTYEIFAAYWPYVGGETTGIGEIFDRTGKDDGEAEAIAMGEAFTKANKYVLTRGSPDLELVEQPPRRQPRRASRHPRRRRPRHADPGQQHALSGAAGGGAARPADGDDLPGRARRRQAAVRRGNAGRGAARWSTTR